MNDRTAADERNASTADGHPLPTGWRLTTLDSLSAGPARYGSPEPAEPFDPYLPRYVRITDIDDLGDLRPDKRASLTRTKAAQYRLKPGDLLFARSGSTVGKTYLYNPHDGECAHGGYLIRFPIDPARCLPAYVAQYTRSPAYWAWVRRTQRQAAQPNINAEELRALPVPVPPLATQRRIVATLSASDRIIRASTRILAKNLELKRGLVVELMTRGVDRQGRLRPLDERRATAIGPVPGDWPVEPVTALLAKRPYAMRSGPFGSELKKSELCALGVPFLGIDNVHIDRFVAEYRRFVSPQTARRLDRYRVYPGDVMITIMGTVGRACVVPDDVGHALSSKHVWTSSFDPERYLGSLVALQFNHAPWVRAHFRRDEQGGTMTAIRSDTLRTVLLPVPPIDEQRRIAAILSDCERRIASEQALIARHEMVQRGLRDELFSGQVRIAQ